MLRGRSTLRGCSAAPGHCVGIVLPLVDDLLELQQHVPCLLWHLVRRARARARARVRARARARARATVGLGLGLRLGSGLALLANQGTWAEVEARRTDQKRGMLTQVWHDAGVPC